MNPIIQIRTLEDRESSPKAREFSPPTGNHIYEPFPIDDPFGLRKAIVPVYLEDTSRTLSGIGTAFHADSWGTLISATHLFDELIESGSIEKAGSKDLIYNNRTKRAVVLLGIGLAIGRASVPPDAIAPVQRIRVLNLKGDDPFKKLRHEVDLKPLDVAIMHLAAEPIRDLRQNLPIRLRGWVPNKDELVFALGYPQIEATEAASQDASVLLGEKFCGAFGKVLAAYPEGRGRIFPTPVIEIETRWPSGMSGGPVFNMTGEVIGVVSRSFYPDEDNATASCFELMPMLINELPSINPDYPSWRIGWEAFEDGKKNVPGFFPTKRGAEEQCMKLGDQFSARCISRKIGTEDYIFQS